MPTPRRGRAQIHIAAPPLRVYELVTDVTRMGEWSPECYWCEWLDAATTASVGARFRGYNRRGRYRWERTAIVQTADAGHEFAFVTVNDRTGRHETHWQYTMEPSGWEHSSPSSSNLCGARSQTEPSRCSFPAGAKYNTASRKH